MAYTAYTGGNTDLDKEIEKQSAKYFEAKAAGNVQGMIDANNTANQTRNQYGYAAEYAGDDIANVAAQSSLKPLSRTTDSLSSAGGSVASNGYLNDLYAAKRQQAVNALQSAYNQNVSTLDANRAQITPTYQNAKNQAAATSEVNARNFNEFATAAGLNTGASGQAALARGNVLQGSLTKLNTAEANSLSENDRQRALLTTQYENAVAQANATGNYELANALYNEYTRQTSLNASTANAQAERENALRLAAYNDGNDWRNLQAQLENQYKIAQLNADTDLEQSRLSAARSTSSSGSGSSTNSTPSYTLADVESQIASADNAVKDTDYSTAVSAMTKANVPNAVASNAMTKNEWIRRKYAGDPVASAFDTYDEYVQAYGGWATATYGG